MWNSLEMWAVQKRFCRLHTQCSMLFQNYDFFRIFWSNNQYHFNRLFSSVISFWKNAIKNEKKKLNHFFWSSVLRMHITVYIVHCCCFVSLAFFLSTSFSFVECVSFELAHIHTRAYIERQHRFHGMSSCISNHAFGFRIDANE